MNMISDTIKYIGVDDLDIDLFESQYVVPEGMSYNSYLIDDDKIAVLVLQVFAEGLESFLLKAPLHLFSNVVANGGDIVNTVTDSIYIHHRTS